MRNRLVVVVASSPRRGKEGRGLFVRHIGEGCIARRGGIGQCRDRTSIEGRQEGVMRGTNGDNPERHRDLRGR